MYWLEFKNDEEFSEGVFGGIRGGNALKFGIYQQPTSGKWFTGTSMNVSEISVDEAIDFARQQRDQMVAASRILLTAGDDPSAVDFVDLEVRLMAAAPLVARTAWGHKYLGLISPELVDKFHAQSFKEYHLIRLLQFPPRGDRYITGGCMHGSRSKVGIPLGRFCRLLVYVNGGPRRYWRVAAGSAGSSGAAWSGMREGGYVAVSWEADDLSDIAATKAGKEERRGRIAHVYQSPASLGQETQQLFNFLTAMNEGDIIVAEAGDSILGICSAVIGPAESRAERSVNIAIESSKR